MISVFNSRLQYDQTLNSSVWTNGPSLSLSAGVFTLKAEALITCATTGIFEAIRIVDQNNNVIACKEVQNNFDTATLELELSYQTSSPVTLTLQATASSNSAILKAAATTGNGQGTNVTFLNALAF